MRAIYLRTLYLENPIGIDSTPEFSWNLEGSGKHQTAYEIQTAHTEEELINNKLVWSSGKVSSKKMYQIPYQGEVQSRERIVWRVRIWDEQDQVDLWSDIAFFEMGLLEKQDWKASWICGDFIPQNEERYPVDEFRKKIHISSFVKARLYIGACGIYKTKINGEKIGNQVLTPGVTDYGKRVQYQTYDITDMLLKGDNTWDISLGDGWFSGKLGVFGASKVFGSQPCVIAQIELTDENGMITEIVTDETFAWSNDGPVRFNDMKDGETYDASMVPSYSKLARKTQWDAPLCCSDNVPIHEKETFSPKVILTPDGSTILDFGQNIAGYVQFSIQGEKGHEVKLTMGEMLDDNGNFTLDNIVQEFEFAPDYCDDSRFQTIFYRCGSSQRETYKPGFAIQGFQYVKLENWPEAVIPENFKAIAVYSDMPQLSEFICSSKNLEKMVHNTLWSVKSNFLDVPTDCPTRERAAWTGDAQLFFDAGCYFMDFTAFFKKWIRDMFDDQAEDGKVYNIVPRVSPHEGMSNMVEGSSGWTDAGILIPYRYWKHFGDVTILKTYYTYMKKLADFLVSRMGDTSDPELDQKLFPGELRAYVVTTGFHFGEWNEPESTLADTSEPKFEEATAYLSYTLKCFSEIAEAINEKADAEKYRHISEMAKKAYQHYFLGNGDIESDRMCKYVRPLALNLANDEQKNALQKGLLNLVEKKQYHVETGFLSTPFVLQQISEAGGVEAAYKMLEKEDYPSWIYEISQGATTIWENWNGEASRNHYSNGAVCDWIFRTVCGIRVSGENEFTIEPMPGGSLSHAKLTYRSFYGEVVCGWKKDENGVEYSIHIPVGCDAKVILPGSENKIIDSGDYSIYVDIE